jgi:hypothetical protein
VVPSRRRRSLSLTGLVSLVLLVAVLATALAACGSAASGGEVGSTPGKMAPPFSGVTLDGDIVTMEDYRGRPLFLVYMTSG